MQHHVHRDRTWNNHKTQSPKNACRTISTEERCRQHCFKCISVSTWGSDQRTRLHKLHTWIPRDCMIQLKINPRSHIPPQQKTEINFQSNHFTHRHFYTQKLLNTEAFTHRSFYTQTPLHTDHFTHRRFYTQTLLHTDHFTHRHFYTQKLLNTEAFTHRSFYTQKLLHTEAFTHRAFYTQRLLHADASAHRRFYTQTLLHTDPFTHKHFHTQRPDRWNRNFTSVFDVQRPISC